MKKFSYLISEIINDLKVYKFCSAVALRHHASLHYE